MSGIFQFKQFSVDQSNCAMKINTDGVLLGALVDSTDPLTILDIGTGTGVIALMLAQRFPVAAIDAVEIDGAAAATAARNFQNSPFANRMNMFPVGFEAYFNQHDTKKYHLIVSNPPFFIDSLKSPVANRSVAKHTDTIFFQSLISFLTFHLSENGICWLVLPDETSSIVKTIAANSKLYLQNSITIHSFKDSAPHREIVAFGFTNKSIAPQEFVIYDAPKMYSKEYRDVLKDFLTIF